MTDRTKTICPLSSISGHKKKIKNNHNHYNQKVFGKKAPYLFLMYTCTRTQSLNVKHILYTLKSFIYIEM